MFLKHGRGPQLAIKVPLFFLRPYTEWAQAPFLHLFHLHLTYLTQLTVQGTVEKMLVTGQARTEVGRAWVQEVTCRDLGFI